MSYELFITRAEGWPETEHWSESLSQRITFEEWESLVQSDPELAIDYVDRLSEDECNHILDSHPEFAGCRTEDQGLRFTAKQDELLRRLASELKSHHTANAEDFEFGCDTADWTAHPAGQRRCFWFHRGAISAENPDLATLQKLLQLSERLDACLRGDDGEIYRTSDVGYECYTPNRGWQPLEVYHWGRPDWAPTIIREIAERNLRRS